VSGFLNIDLLGQANLNNQAGPNIQPDRELTVRQAMDRAAGSVARKLEHLPLVEAAIRQIIGNSPRYELRLSNKWSAPSKSAPRTRR
jgi:hypothetical protein